MAISENAVSDACLQTLVASTDIEREYGQFLTGTGRFGSEDANDIGRPALLQLSFRSDLLSSMSEHDLSHIVGGQLLSAKRSAVNDSGMLRQSPIADVILRPTRPVPHEDGHVTEVARASWEIIGEPIAQVHLTTTLPGRHRAWGLHRKSTDRLFVARGLVKFAVFDGRLDSKTCGCVNEFTLSETSPGLLIIPPYLYHGWKNIGTDEAIIINMPTAMYNYDAPDALDLPWDSEAASQVIPYRF